MKKQIIASIAATALTAGGLVVATAAPAQAMCPDKTGYTLHATQVAMPFKHVKQFKDGKGGKIVVSKSYSGSVSYNVTAGAEAEVGTVFAKAKVSVSSSLTKTNSTSATHTYEHAISKGKYGHVRYVSWGKRVSWKKWHQVTTSKGCQIKNLRSGVINFPTKSEGWQYWETKS
ncbi:hypothetical protein FOE78_10430 [Microlunatus elymi]|uniref:Uncharacterized protein n=1 Tax=Microlunatus elymi TaxID=2596828 RepID=A0A516PYL2_9ACTN|nr:hypothetical protein [Microlunatus elymi]QDP96258.1 hypothetical protein FOE78_10430 [Microlunatus elymi]